jgi:excinuclease UvrABC nuclease subunit
MIAFDPYLEPNFEIVYVGSTVKLNARYKSHKIPNKIQAEGKMNIMYYKPMSKGFYDLEIKLIKKLQPKFNKAHKNG